MKKITIALITALLISLIGQNVFAAVYSVSLENLPEISEIEAITLFFDTGASFDITTYSLVFGDAVRPNPPGDILYPWTFVDSNPIPDNGILTIDAYNSDILDENVTVVPPFGQFSDGQYNENNLINGVVFSFEYTGDISFDSFVLGNSNGDPVTYAALLSASETLDGLTITAVPLPSALLIFGSGLVGLIGIRRKTMRK